MRRRESMSPTRVVEPIPLTMPDEVWNRRSCGAHLHPGILVLRGRVRRRVAFERGESVPEQEPTPVEDEGSTLETDAVRTETDRSECSGLLVSVAAALLAIVATLVVWRRLPSASADPATLQPSMPTNARVAPCVHLGSGGGGKRWITSQDGLLRDGEASANGPYLPMRSLWGSAHCHTPKKSTRWLARAPGHGYWPDRLLSVVY
jgi:hypothetical protein